MAITNLTNLTSAQNTYELVKFANDVTLGYLSVLFIISIFIIITLISMKNYEFDEALTLSAFISFGISIYLSVIFIVLIGFVIGVRVLGLDKFSSSSGVTTVAQTAINNARP